MTLLQVVMLALVQATMDDPVKEYTGYEHAKRIVRMALDECDVNLANPPHYDTMTPENARERRLVDVATYLRCVEYTIGAVQAELEMGGDIVAKPDIPERKEQ